VCFAMRKLKSDLASRNVHLSSAAPVSVRPRYHKILVAVKGWRGTPPSWGSVDDDRGVGRMIVKLADSSGRVWITINGRRRLSPLGLQPANAEVRFNS
jgi:hypothetical protein